ncbi:MAG: phosphotransferase [Kiritimatiellae bacterium]|nr:phosphotransferase [Kiritimatiellia bacterium]
MNAKKAIVLAAGLGTRLRPLTTVCPKPLMPVWGEPMLARVVALLRSWGVEDIAVNCHYLHDQVEQWCAANGCRAVYEPEILGTGGVLNPLRDWIGEDDFYLVNGDIVVEGIDECPFDISDSSDDVIGECLVTEEGPRTIEVESESRFVTCWKSPDAGYHGTFTYCGIALLKAGILKFVEPTGFSSIVQAYERAMMEGRFMRSRLVVDMLWTDAGTIDSYVDLNTAGEDNAFDALPQISAAAKASGLEDAPVRFLFSRGSDRCFFSLGSNAIAIVYDDLKRAENARYASHARWLKERGVSVPEVLADLPDKKTLVLECVGSERRMTLDDYTKVVEALAEFNALDALEIESVCEHRFDDGLWRWEREFFAKYCLEARFGVEMSADVLSEFEKVASVLSAEPTELVHRDFQSTNVLWKGDKLYFIDFQGMRPGPAIYDLASLLYDPYVKLTDKERSLLAAYYAKLRGRDDITEKLPYAAVQRLAQALGAYGRLASVGQTKFTKYVLPALENLLAAADDANLDAIGALAEDLIARETESSNSSCGHGPGCTCGGGHGRG